MQRRPALVVAMPIAPGAPGLLWVLMVTSAANLGWPGDVPISDIEAAGLPAPSVVRVAKIAAIESLYAEPIGILPDSDRAHVIRLSRECLALSLGVPSS